MRSDSQVSARLARLRNLSLVTGLVGAAVCAAEALFAPQRFYPAYLAAWLFWWGVSSGSLAIAMIHHLSGGAWGLAIRRILEAAYVQLPIVAIGFVPIWLGLPRLYEWADAEHVSHDPLLQQKAWYLNETAFIIRAVIYFMLWSLVGLILSRLSIARAGDPRGRLRALALISGPGLLIWGLGVTFASIDWAMSLEPHWASTTFGVLVAAGQAVGAMSLAIAILALVGDVEPFATLAPTDVRHDLGNFLLAFVMFWAYISFTQFLIIWSANLPEETPWYLQRGTGGWQWIAALLAVMHFAVPFLLLLARQTKRNTHRLVSVALLLTFMRIVDWNWLVMPTFAESLASALSLSMFAAPIAIGGLWLASFSWRLSARADLPMVLPVAEAHE
jgi:hypothetical protein